MWHSVIDEEVFRDPGELFSNLVEVEEVNEEELSNNQQANENHVHEESDNDEKLCHFDSMDEESESSGEVKIFHLNLDAFGTTEGGKGRMECFMKGEDVDAFMEDIDHS